MLCKFAVQFQVQSFEGQSVTSLEGFEGKLGPGSLPSALRRAMVEKFGDFDEHQMAKHNKKPAKSVRIKHIFHLEPSSA